MGGVEIGILSTLVGALIWYLKHQTRAQSKREEKSDEGRKEREEKRDIDQKEERDYYRNVIDGSLQKNAVLNAKSLSLQKKMMKDFKDHNGHSERFSVKVIETLSLQTDAITLVCNKLNGGSPDMVAAKKNLNKDRREANKRVGVERRK